MNLNDVNTLTQKDDGKIFFGIMCRGMYFPQWEADAINTLLKHEQIECCLLIIDKRNLYSGKIKNIVKQFKLKNILWLTYLFFANKKSKANKRVNLTSILKNIPKIECQVIKKGNFSEYFKDSDISEIKKYNLDFILRFGFGIIKGEILNAAKYGIWSFHHDDEQKYRGGPPCFWEIYNNDKITGSLLQRITEKLDSGIVLRKGFLKTNLSYIKNRDQMYLESSKWPRLVCIDILNGNTDYLHGKPSKTKASIYFAPTNFQFIIFLLNSCMRRFQNLIKGLTFIDQWNIGIVNKPVHSFLEDKNSCSLVTWFPKLPKNKFFADPFGIVDENRIHIFFEDYNYNKSRGEIAYTCYENGNFSIPQIVISEPFHLSYPYLFKYNEGIYMIPESYQANKIILYKAMDFPLNWRKEHVLIDNFEGIDTTLIYYNGIWWMFTSDKNDGSSYNLNLFYTDDIFSKWQPHPQNSVKTDIRAARSAGKPFIYNGDLYRPSIDYSEKCQGSITINKIVKLTTKEYKEVIYSKIRPIKDTIFSDKIHTLSDADKYSIIDGCKEKLIFTNVNLLKFRIIEIIRKIKQKNHNK